jgi:hypothetical protein
MIKAIKDILKIKYRILEEFDGNVKWYVPQYRILPTIWCRFYKSLIAQHVGNYEKFNNSQEAEEVIFSDKKRRIDEAEDDRLEREKKKRAYKKIFKEYED